MSKNNRCFRVSLSNIKAIVFVDMADKKIKASCTNYEVCYYSRILNNGECPKYCELISELRKYVFRGRKSKAEIQEIEFTAPKIASLR
jgi:acetylglutamate synthase